MAGNPSQIYGAVIGGHLGAFPADIRRFGNPVLEATISLHRSVCAKFLPTAIKFYYGFNLRDLSCLVQVPARGYVCFCSDSRYAGFGYIALSRFWGVLRSSVKVHQQSHPRGSRTTRVPEARN